MVDGKHLRGSGKGKSAQVKRVEVLALRLQTTLAQARAEGREEKGFQPEGVLFDAWYAARQVLERLKLSFYPCRRRLIAGKLSLDLSPLLPVQVEAA